MLKIRRPLGRLIFNMGIAIPGKTVFLIETAPSFMLFGIGVQVGCVYFKGNIVRTKPIFSQYTPTQPQPLPPPPRHPPMIKNVHNTSVAWQWRHTFNIVMYAKQHFDICRSLVMHSSTCGLCANCFQTVLPGHEPSLLRILIEMVNEFNTLYKFVML